MVETKNVILITGQSGIKVDKCVEHIVEGLDGFTHIRFKKHLDSVLSNLHPIPKEAFKMFLCMPPMEMHKWWQAAFKEMMSELSSHVDTTCIITFHGCHYNQRKREFLYPTGLDELQLLSGRVLRVVTLIDDCFDIYARLCEPDEMYHRLLIEDEGKSKDHTLLLNVARASQQNLTDVLMWRALEIAFSRLVAYWLKGEFYVLAVKHPLKTGQRLFSLPSDHMKVKYVSHPITKVRTAPSESAERARKYIAELNIFIEEEVNKNDDLVLFIPDTIDELRFTTGAGGFPDLDDHWDLPFSKQERICPASIAPNPDFHPLYPLGRPGKKALSEMKARVDSLKDKIDQQIDSRDHTLVEQASQGLVVYRPRFLGYDVSDGVSEEIMYNKDLRDQGESTRLLSVYEHSEDYAEFAIRKLDFTVRRVLGISTDSNTEGKVSKKIKEARAILSRFINDEMLYCTNRIHQQNEQDLLDLISRAKAQLGELKSRLVLRRKSRKSALDGDYYQMEAVDWDKRWEEIHDTFLREMQTRFVFYKCLEEEKGDIQKWLDLH